MNCLAHKEVLRPVIYIKDKYNVSGAAFYEMAQLCKSMPCRYKLKDQIAELNTSWIIFPIPDGILGVHQSFEE